MAQSSGSGNCVTEGPAIVSTGTGESDGFVALSARQAQLVKLLAAGESEAAIAARLHVSEERLRSDLNELSAHLRQAAAPAPSFEQPLRERAS